MLRSGESGKTDWTFMITAHVDERKLGAHLLFEVQTLVM
jgi:hypothetical protein